MPTTFTGGKLKLKGSSSSSSSSEKKKRKIEETNSEKVNVIEKVTDIKPDDYLTEAQKRNLQKKSEADLRQAKKLTKLTYRERLEQFNYKLSIKTEHNDIPRISAAGNG